MAKRELTDDEVFGGQSAELSDAEVFGTKPKKAGPNVGVGELKAYNPTIGEQLGNAFTTLIGTYDKRPLIDRIQGATGQVVDAVTPDPIQRGYNMFRRDVSNMLPSIPSVYGPEAEQMNAEIAKANIQRDIERYPMSEKNAATVQAMSQAGGVSDWLGAVADNPAAAGELIVESLARQALPLAANVVSPIIGVPATLAGTAAAEKTSTEDEAMARAGVDLTDPQAVMQYRANNAEAVRQAEERGNTRAAVIAPAEAASMAIAGRVPILGPLLQGTGLKNAVSKSLGDVVVQPTIAAAGETGAQLAADGGISSVGDIITESALEVPGGVLEGAPAVVRGYLEDRATAQPGELSDAEVFSAQPEPAPAQPQPQPAAQAAPPPTSPAPAAPVATPPPAEPQAPAAGAGATTTPAPAPVEPQPVQPAPAEPPAAQAPAEPQPVQAPAAPAGNRRTVTTASGRKVDTEFQVVDLATLQAATGDLQNRDRSRATSDLQIQNIAGNLDPERLGDSAEADRGAPIVGPDNVVESGNGRVAAIRKAYESIPERAEAYRQYLASQGYNTEGMAQPVLVRRRLTEMTPEERRAFVIEANTSATARLNATEQAKSDADLIGDDVMQLYKGGEFGMAGNRDFVRALIGKLPQSEQAALYGADGALSQEGIRRIQNAMLARAYGDAQLLSKFTEDSDNNIRSVGGAMLDISGAWAQLRGDVRAGRVKPEFDITNDIVAAAQRISLARDRSETVQQVLSQSDAFNPMSPVTEKLIRAFYDKNLTRAAGRDKIAETLRAYAAEAQKQTTDASLFGDLPAVTPEQILDAQLGKRVEAAPAQQTSMFGAGGRPTVQAQPEPQPATKQATTSSPEDLEARAKALEPKVNALSMEDVKRALLAIGEKPRANKNPYDQLMAQHPDDIEQALAAVQPQAAEDRAPMADRATDAAMEDTINDDLAELEQEPQPNQRGRNATPETMRVSFTNRRSWAEQAFRDAGYDPDVATLWPIDRQFETLSKLIKDRFGITAQKTDTLPSRFAVDQLLDMYRNLQFMAHVMGLPADAMGLRGKLNLVFRKGMQYFGAFYPTAARVENVDFPAGTIVLPKRSNSFAHEWMHALDHYLIGHFGDTDFALLSQKIKKAGIDYEPGTVKEAFVSVMDHLFYDQSSLAKKVLALELALENPKLSKTAKAKAEAQLASLKRGNARPADVEASDYKTKSAAFDPRNPDYWANPQEMLARAFEAYTAFKVEMAGGSTEAIAKGDLAYLSTADKRLAETFPKGDERFRIFAAFDRLFGMMAKEQLIADGVAAGVPNNMDKFDPHVWHRTPTQKPEYKGIFGAVRETVDDVRASVDRMRREAERPENPKPLAQRIQDVLKEYVSAEMAVFRIFEKRYKDSKAVRMLAEMLVTAPGENRTVKRVFEEAADTHYKMMMNRLSNIADRYDLHRINEAEQQQLRDLLISEDAPRASEQIRKAAGELRRLLDMEWYNNQEAGLEIGYAKNGYLPRMLDMAKVVGNRTGFVEAAAKVYELVFDKEYGADVQEVMERGDNYSGVTAFLKQAKQSGIDVKPAVKALRQLRRLEAQMAKSEDPDILRGKVDEASEKLQELLGDMYDQVRSDFGVRAAQAWHSAIMTADTHDFDAMAPDAQYTKSRKLPPQTDKLMEDYFLNDPLEVINSYLMQSARRTEYARRFGPKGEKLQKLFKAMASEGVTRADQAYMAGMVARLTGRARHDISPELQAFLSGMQIIGTITLLPRAVWSSVAEPIMAGWRTGNAKDIFLPHFNMIKQAVGTADAKDWAEIARVIGLVTTSMADTLAANRFGGNFGDSPRMQRVMANFGKRSLLHGITNASRTAILPLQHEYLMGLARRIRDGRDVANSTALLREVGVSDIKGFTDWLLQHDRMPTMEELFDSNGIETRYGTDWITAMHRISEQTVQAAKTYNRPKMANNPHGRLIYGILSFAMTFYENVWKRTGKLLGGISERSGKMSAAQYAALNVLPAMTGLFIAQTLVSTIREAVFNPERWEEWEKEGVLFERLMQLGFTRSFSFGLADVPIQAYTGLKYQRDLSNMMIGAVPSYFLQAIQGMAQPVVANSDKTNNAEYKAAQSAYQLIAAPAFAYGLSVVPGGRLLDPLYGAGMQYLTAPASRDAVADQLVGEKDSRVKARERAERKADKEGGGRGAGRETGREAGRETGRETGR